MNRTATKEPETRSTGLAVISASDFRALAPLSDEMKAAMAANDAVGETFGPTDLLKVPIPTAGGTTFEIPTQPVTKADELTGVLVYVQRTGVLWPGEDPSPGTMPVLRTFDMEVAEQVGPIPPEMLDTLNKYRIDERHYRWADLPYNQFGSGKNGVGKRCKEMRMLFLLRPGDVFPIHINVTPGSLKAWKKFWAAFITVGIPYYRAVVSLKLDGSNMNKNRIKFSSIVPSLVGQLSAEDGARVEQQYTRKLATMAREVSLTADGASEADE